MQRGNIYVRIYLVKNTHCATNVKDTDTLFKLVLMQSVSVLFDTFHTLKIQGLIKKKFLASVPE